jgi:hypothetical protein
MSKHLLALILAMAMVYATTASNYGRGNYGRVMLDADTQGYSGWNTVDKVSPEKKVSVIGFLCSLRVRIVEKL